MKKAFSCYLDLVRFIAALAVVADHFASHVLGAGRAHFVPELGREAVMVFFVLSGFVIAFITETKEHTVRQYVVARAARIYSVALPMLLLAFCAAFISEKITGRAVAFDYQLAKAYFYIPFHLLFLGEMWRISEQPIWLESYWSLAYEVWYYVFFASVFFFRGKKRIVWALLVLLIIGYKLWLLLPVWYSGVLLWRRRAAIPLGKWAARAGWLLSIGGFCAYKVFGWDAVLRLFGASLWPFPGLPLGSADRYLCDYAVCVLICLNFYCAAHAEFLVLEKCEALIRNISSYTFTLYLSHVLVLALWEYFGFDRAAGFWQGLALIPAILTVTLAIGAVTEHRRRWFAGSLTLLYDFFASRLQRTDAAISKTRY